jgi:hypothetical protein
MEKKSHKQEESAIKAALKTNPLSVSTTLFIVLKTNLNLIIYIVFGRVVRRCPKELRSRVQPLFGRLNTILDWQT